MKNKNKYNMADILSSKGFVFLFALVCLSPANMFSQTIRTMSLGNMTLAVKDKENSFNPFDMGRNPAWLYESEKDSWLRVSPSVSGNWGDYKRLYDPGRSSMYGVEFEGIKTLGDNGTFLGYTNYTYDKRNDVYRSLKYDTYAGESFFFDDTSTGNFKYEGPKINFMYSWELLPNLFCGASASYRILKGLKEEFSYAQTTYRNFTGDAGLAYKLLDNLVIGTDFQYLDSQEKIESSDVNLMNVLIYYYRGETYSIYRNLSVVDEKFRTKGYAVNSQIYWLPDESSEVGITGSYSSADKKTLIPFQESSSESYNEYEDGYSNFANYNVSIKGRYEISPALTAGISAEYNEGSCWSKYTTLQLLLWDWKVRTRSLGAGVSYNPMPSLMIGCEYEYSKLNADSAKYIDGRYTTLNSDDHLLKIGAEYALFSDLTIRAGYNYGTLKNDLYGGGKNVKYNMITCGAGVVLSSIFTLDAMVGYSDYKPENFGSRNRSNIVSKLMLTLNSF